MLSHPTQRFMVKSSEPREGGELPYSIGASLTFAAACRTETFLVFGGSGCGFSSVEKELGRALHQAMQQKGQHVERLDINKALVTPILEATPKTGLSQAFHGGDRRALCGKFFARRKQRPKIRAHSIIRSKYVTPISLCRSPALTMLDKQHSFKQEKGNKISFRETTSTQRL